MWHSIDSKEVIMKRSLEEVILGPFYWSLTSKIYFAFMCA